MARRPNAAVVCIAAAAIGLLTTESPAKVSGLGVDMNEICLTWGLVAETALLLWPGGPCAALIWDMLGGGAAEADWCEAFLAALRSASMGMVMRSG